MSKVSIERKSSQEKELDFVQGILRKLVHQVEYNISSYRPQDVRALREALSAVDKVTLLTDEEVASL